MRRTSSRVTRNVDWGQTLSNKTLDSSNAFPASLATLTGNQTLSNKTLDSSNAFPASLATLTGNQILSNKTLDSSTLTSANTFPGLGVLPFQGTGPNSGTTFFGTAGAPGAEAVVQALVPGLTVKKLLCRANTTNLTATKRWEIYLRKGSLDASAACNLNSAAAICTVAVTPNAVYNGSTDLLALKVTAVGGPPNSTNLVCTLSAGF
jgi:uncharacterized membrane protein